MSPSHEESSVRPILSLGRYALFGELATGGMATVHFGRMSSLGGFNRTVAIKRMRRDIARDPEFVAMFLDEARLTSRIEHPNVVATLDVVAEAGEVFLVMEYVRGESLQRLRRAAKSRREKVPVPVAISIMGQVLAGLHAAHEAVGEAGTPLGIVHRDVSPQNIMVGEDGISRITDFGIAKAESRLQVTHDGQMKGKLPYMAPEQLGSSGRTQIDRRVDIFSSAVVLWELLAGKGLFRADHPGETIAKVLSAPIPALAPYRSDVTPALDRVLRRALSRKPDQRPQTAEQFACELEESIATGPASPRVVSAWVASLAGDVLANRTKYVREMESTSWNLAEASVVGPSSAAVLDPEPDLSSEPSDIPQVPARAPAPPPPPKDARPASLEVPSVSTAKPPAGVVPAPAPPVAPIPRPPQPSSAAVPPAQPQVAGPLPSVVAGGVSSAAPSEPVPADDSSMPSVSSMPSAGGTEHVDSIPPIPKRRLLPFVLLAAVVAGTVLLFVVAVASSSSWVGGSDDPVVAPGGGTTGSSPPAQPLPKADPPVTSVEPSGLQDKAPDASASENDQNGGSLEVRTIAPPVTAPPRVPVPGTRAAPYLPDLP